jgi:hypothetical protein
MDTVDPGSLGPSPQGRCIRTQYFLLTQGGAQSPTCENVALLVAVDIGLLSNCGCRSCVDTAVGPGKQAAPGHGIDPLAPKCIVGQADPATFSGLRAKGRNRNLFRRGFGDPGPTQASGPSP